MSTWGDVAKGDRVQLGTRVLVVDKVKHKGKKVRIVVHDKLGTFDREVKAKDAVTIVPLRKLGDGRASSDDLHDRMGAQQRWAKQGESDGDEPKPKKRKQLEGPHHGSPWDTPADKTERTLQQVLGATLVEESIDGGRTYAVPPVDISSVAAHLLIMHGGELGPDSDPVQLMAVHSALHEDNDVAVKVPHYHSETRP